MTTRFTTAALALALSLSAGSAFAQSYTAPAGVPAAAASLGFSASPLVAQGYLPAYQDNTRAEPVTTGSVSHGTRRHAR